MILKADSDGRHKAVHALDRLAAGVHEHEATGSVGIFHVARLEAALAEQRALLVSAGSGDRYLAAVQLELGLAVDMAGGFHLRQEALRNVQQLKQSLVPAQLMDIEEHRAAGIGVIGHVDTAARQLPDEPCVDGSEQQLAALGAFARTGDVVEQPLYFAAGEVRVRHKSGLFADHVAVAFGNKLVDDGRGAAALPDDGVCNRLAGGLVPDDGGLALVCDADGGNVRRRHAELIHRGAGDLQRRIPDLCGVVFHPARLREYLPELLLYARADIACVVKKDAAGAGSALIESHNILHSFNSVYSDMSDFT